MIPDIAHSMEPVSFIYFKPSHVFCTHRLCFTLHVSMVLYTPASYNLPFTRKERPFITNKIRRFLNFAPAYTYFSSYPLKSIHLCTLSHLDNRSCLQVLIIPSAILRNLFSVDSYSSLYLYICHTQRLLS